MRSPFNPLLPAGLICALQLCLCFVAGASRADAPKPAASQTAAILACATRNRDNLDDGERECLFNLVADPCIKKASDDADTATVVGCYRIEAQIWAAVGDAARRPRTLRIPLRARGPPRRGR